jgi:hypothetical protein
MIQNCRCSESSFDEQKQGRGFSRVPVWEDSFAILLFRGDLGRVGEVQIVVVLTVEVDPTLNGTVWRKASAHCHRQRSNRSQVPLPCSAP